MFSILLIPSQTYLEKSMFILIGDLVFIIAFVSYRGLDACAVEVITYHPGLFLSFDVNMKI
jgi:hypothetical protein